VVDREGINGWSSDGGQLSETARLIPDGALRLNEGKTHEGAIIDNRLPQDVLEFDRGTRADTATT
jgi:hypothetical protein